MFSILSFVGCNQKPLTVADVDQQVNAALPVGTERARVLTVLDSLRLDHSDFDEKTRTIGAKMEDHRKKGIVTHSFHITFVFDSTSKLVSHETKELFTGP
jgi:hypothetical protein